jgi:high affinity sulfate transporter 1
MRSIQISLPLVNTFRTYNKKWLRYDFIAGATVAAVVIPQAMAYTSLAGSSPVSGLYAALIAMFVYAIFSSSSSVIMGPDAAMAALTGAALLPLANGDPSRYMGLLAIMGILIGIATLVCIYARLGFVAEFLSRPILLGYMGGLALAVIASQAPKLFGITLPVTGNFFTTFAHIITHLGETHMGTLGLSLILTSFAVSLQRWIKRLPVALILLIVATVTSALLQLGDHGVALIEQIPTGLPLPRWPVVTFYDVQSLIVPATTIMLIGYANTIATARSFAIKRHEQVDTTQESFGLGAANIMSGIFGGIPVAASGARTAINYGARAKTQVAQVCGATVVAAVLVALAPALRFLPVPALAVIIIMAAIKLFNWRELVSIWHAWRSEALLAIVTLFGVTVLGIFQGLLLAILMELFNHVRKSAFPHDAVLGVAETGAIRDMRLPPKTHLVPGIIMYRFDAPLYFGNANYFRDRVHQLIAESPDTVHWFLWDAETITAIDSTGGQMLLNLIRELKSQGIVFAIARMKGPIRQVVGHSRRLSRVVQSTPHFAGMGEALEAFKAEHPPAESQPAQDTK